MGFHQPRIATCCAASVTATATAAIATAISYGLTAGPIIAATAAAISLGVAFQGSSTATARHQRIVSVNRTYFQSTLFDCRSGDTLPAPYVNVM